MAKSPNNPYDELGGTFSVEEVEGEAKDQEAKSNRIDYLIHRVFQQTTEGQELLEIWKESLIVSPGAEEGMDSIGVGIREGMKRMIRNIILTVRRVENG